MRQKWRDLLFCHWAVEPGRVQATLPRGLHADLFDGKAWIGVVPFFMRGVRPVFAPALPWLSDFLELNVRTYVHDESGLPGVWFYSLDCNQPAAVWIARAFFHLNYRHAAMRAERRGGFTRYRSRLRGESWETFFRYAPQTAPRPAAPGSLEFFLVERHLLFAADKTRRLWSGRVHHAPYEISEAISEISIPSIPRLSGFPVLDRPPDHVCHSPGADVRIYPLRRHRQGAAG